ncbi:MAG TPA: hypothetical protein VGO11_04550 [Chthoniobacteraceae bacterium]|jgi:hypothetical protein|nr:hypothetical protein [Chthoniobacteraceae bacterium]
MNPPLPLSRRLLAVWLAALACGQLFAQTPANVPDLERLETAHAKEVGEKLDAPFLAGLQRLNESFRVTLETAMKKAIAQGELDETLAYQNESKRFAAANDIPEKDEPGLHPGVAKLRSFWRAEAARLTKIRATGLPPLDAAYLANLRTLEKDLTRALKIDEAQAVRTRINTLAAQAAAAPPEPAGPPAPVAPTSAPATPKPGFTIAPFARAVDKADLYASGNNGLSICLNGKEILRAGRDSAGKARITLKEGDVLAARSSDRFDINSFWISCLGPTGEFLFETSPAWKSYLPVAADKWWDTKKTKEQQPVEEAPDKQEYVDVVKRSAALTPAYHGGQPIHSTLKEDTGRASFVMYTVTKADLLPKKVDPSLVVDYTAMSAPFLGKTFRIATARGGPECIVLGEVDPMIAAFDPAATPSRGNAPQAQFKIGRGTQLGTIVFESVAKPGLYLRHEGFRLHLTKGILSDSLFYLQKPLTGAEGYSIATQNHLNYFLVVNDRNGLDLVQPAKMKDMQKAVFFLEPAK